MTYERAMTGPGLPHVSWATAAQAETDEVLQACAAVFSAGCRECPSPKFPRDVGRLPSLLYGRGLGADESTGFLRALAENLVIVAPDGGFQVPGARACSANLHLVGRNEDHVVVHTEVLIHITAYAELVLDLGWPQDRLVFDPFVRGAALDLWGFAGTPGDHWWEGEVIFAAEAKARVDGGDGLRSLLTSLNRQAADPQAAANSNHSAKWKELVTLTADRDLELLLVADGARWWFIASRAGSTVNLAPLSTS